MYLIPENAPQQAGSSTATAKQSLWTLLSKQSTPLAFAQRTPAAWLILAVTLLAVTSQTFGYLVGPALTLDKLAAEADIIFKGEAIATDPVEDEWFHKVEGFAVRETRFKIVSRIKGEIDGAELRFRHFDKAGQANFEDFTPQFYHFEAGRTYIVFASKEPGGARQTRFSHTSKMDLGVLRCVDQRPVAAAGAIAEIFWTELIALRNSPVADDVLYAIKQFGQMSECLDRGGTPDFSRLEVLETVHGLISRPEPEIAQAAINLIGAESPYLEDNSAPFWLGTIGVRNPGLGTMAEGTRNAGGALCWRELASVANSGAPPETRALAIRAMGLVKARELRGNMDRWLAAPEIPVRAAAVLLATDFAVPDPYTTGKFAEYAADPAAEVRKCAAYAIGFMQDPGIIPVLTKLMKE